MSGEGKSFRHSGLPNYVTKVLKHWVGDFYPKKLKKDSKLLTRSKCIDPLVCKILWWQAWWFSGTNPLLKVC